MGNLNYEIVVIGAGPAGSRTARLLANRGFSVLLLEKRDRIGYPVRCAEAVGPRADIEHFITLDDSLISAEINGVKVVAPDGRTFEADMPAIGFIVDRELFVWNAAWLDCNKSRVTSPVTLSSEKPCCCQQGFFLSNLGS